MSAGGGGAKKIALLLQEPQVKQATKRHQFGLSSP